MDVRRAREAVYRRTDDAEEAAVEKRERVFSIGVRDKMTGRAIDVQMSDK